jgi:hypothetical protein
MGPPPASYLVCNQALFLGIWSGQGVKLKNVNVKEVKNEESYTRTPPYANIYDMPNIVFMYQAFCRIA